MTESVYAIGAGADLVARGNYCDFPPQVKALPSVGDAQNPDLEAVVALAPTWVLGPSGLAGRSFSSRLEALNIRTFFPPTDTLADVMGLIRGLGVRLERRDQAEQVAVGIERGLAELSAEASKTPRIRILMALGTEQVFSPGPQSFMTEIARTVGADNVVPAGVYPEISSEGLVSLKPELIVFPYGDAEAMPVLDRASPKWHHVDAVKRDALCFVKSDALLRPGPRVVEGARALRVCLNNYLATLRSRRTD